MTTESKQKAEPKAQAQEPAQEAAPTPLAAKPALQRWHLLVMNPLDVTYLVDSSAKTNYKNGHYLVMNAHDAFLRIS
jgi:hypothetical protein